VLKLCAQFVVFCAIALHFSVFAEEIGAEEADADGTAKQLESTIERLNALDEWFSEAEKKRAVWLVELQRQDRDISHLNVEVQRTAALLRTTQNELVELKTEVETTESLKKTQAARIATHIAAAYRLTGQDFLKQLLNQESPDTLDRMMRYHRFFSTSRLEVMVAYRETLAILTTLNVELESQQETQQTRRQALETEKQGLSEERGTRSSLISQLDSEKETRGQEYDRLQQDRVRLGNLLTELRRRSTELDGSAFKTAKGTLPLPVTGPIRHAFGSMRADNRLRWHGIDIESDHGTPITAVFRGRIIFADWLRGFGFLAIVDHGSEYMTLYGHVDVLYKNVGDWVESGEAIAAAGNSGGVRDIGVYFEVRHKGQPQDPINWIDR
jgi:septal ring factor EnvC (AmiA/AmiB activator)